MKKKYISSTVRDIFTVATGTATAQVVLIAFSPLIARLYGPEEFGLQGIFMSLVSILSPAIALRYPMAIVTAETEGEMVQIARVSMVVAFVLACALWLLLLAGGDPLLSLLGAEKLGSLIYLLPCALLCVAVQDVTEFKTSRLGDFRLVGTATVIVALVNTSAKFVSGLFVPVAATLIILNGSAPAFRALLLHRGTRALQGDVSMLGSAAIVSLMRKYQNFPFYRVPADVLNAFSQTLPVILLAALFSATAAGFFVLARTVINLPLNILGNAIGNVLYAKFAALHRGQHPLFPLVLRITLLQLVIPGASLGLVSLFFPDLFAYVFGEKWRAAGIYAQWMSLWLTCMLVNIPAVVALPVIHKQQMHLFFNSVILAAGGMGFWLGYVIGSSAFAAIVAFSIATAFAFTLQMISYLFVIWREDQRQSLTLSLPEAK